MFINKIISNKFFSYLTGALLIYNLIDLISFHKKYSDTFFLYGTLTIIVFLFLVIFKNLKGNDEFAIKIIGFLLLTLFLQGQIRKTNFLPFTAIYYSEDYGDQNNEGEPIVSNTTIKTVLFDTKLFKCDTKKEYGYNIDKQPISEWECMICDNETTNEINKTLKTNFEFYSFNNVKCYLKFEYFIFSGTAVVKGYRDLSNNKDSPFYQFIQYQIEALIYISFSVSLTFFISMLYRKIR